MNSDAVRDVVVRGGASGFAQTVEIGMHHLTADEPVAGGGTDTGPTPYDLLAAALGTCTSMTLAVYARRRGWPLDTVSVRVQHSRVHAADCAACETKEGRIDRLERVIEMTGALTADQRRDLLAIADRCPVHRTLVSEIDIVTRAAGEPLPG